MPCDAGALMQQPLMIDSRVHGILDYVVGLLLILAPYILGFADGGPAQFVPMVLGASTILYSLVTRYELSVAKLIPYRVHLTVDAASGVLLLASPWLFRFADQIWWPHVLVGLVELIVVTLSWSHARGEA